MLTRNNLQILVAWPALIELTGAARTLRPEISGASASCWASRPQGCAPLDDAPAAFRWRVRGYVSRRLITNLPSPAKKNPRHLRASMRDDKRPDTLHTAERTGRVSTLTEPMPWKCPACSTPIRQQLTAAGDDTPRAGVVYRCNVCRLELILGPEDKLVVAPLPADTAYDRPRKLQ